jgi:hypothetical protein
MSRPSGNGKAELTSRQRVLISLVEALGGSISAADFQKLLFLYMNEAEAEPMFKFVPYRFGCLSFGSYAEKRRLIGAGLLEADENAWRLTQAGEMSARQPDLNALKISAFVRKYKKLRGIALVAEVYRHILTMLPGVKFSIRFCRPRKIGKRLMPLGLRRETQDC